MKKRVTNQQLLEAIMSVRTELKDDIKRLDTKIDNLDIKIVTRTSEIINLVNHKTDDIVYLMADFVNFSSDKYNNHEKRIKVLEKATI